MTYNWQHPDWPNFEYDATRIELLLQQFERNSGRLQGLENGLTSSDHSTTLVEMLVTEALTTSAIEGELLHRPDVVSSVRRQLGLSTTSTEVRDQRAKGIASVLSGMRSSFAEPLSEEHLFMWHRQLLSHTTKVRTGQWRAHAEPMQIVSGAIGREIVHFEAPPSHAVPREMERYIAWFNATAPNAESTIQQAPVRAAIAHLYFESIHPFEDGNGRIGRVLAEKALIQTIGAPALMSLSATLEHNKAAYYAALKKAQHTLNINGWLDYFIRVILDAQERAQKTILFTLTKAKFFNEFNNRLNPRQAKVIDRMFMAGPGGFEGGMTATKYMRIARTSKATATRDLQELVAMRALVVQGQGRSTRYGLFMQAHP